MSKIVENIKALGLSERRTSQWVDYRSSYEVHNYSSLASYATVDILRKYEISVRLGAAVLVSERNSEHLVTMVENVKRAVIEELYGEFRKPLLALEINIAEGNQQKSLELVRDIHATMFGLKR